VRRALAIACAVQLAAPTAARAQEPAGAVPVEEEKAEQNGQGTDQATALAAFREGKRQYNERRFREAAEAFERSLAAAWSIEAAYNMALSLDRADDVIAAYRAYRGYLERAATDDQHRATALERSEQLREQIAEVLLQLDSPEAIREIRINGAPVAKDAFPWLTLPGPLDVEFIGEAPGQVKDVRAEVRPGGTATIVFPGFVRNEPPPVVRTPPPVVDKPKPEPRHKRVARAAYAMSGLTLASGAVLVALGAETLKYRNWYAADCPCEPDVAARKDLGRERFDDFKLATNVAVGVTAALGITAIALIVAAARGRTGGSATTRARMRWLGPGVEVGF
jgi:hypothetical protein